MDPITYIMLGTLTLAGLAFALSVAARLSSATGGKPYTAYWATMFGGAGFVLFGIVGLMSAHYLAAGQRGLTPIFSILFVLFGAFQLYIGLRARRAAASK